MDDEAQTLIQRQVKKLPPEVRDALASDDLRVKIRKIGESRHLHIDQVGVLEDEVVMVMMGLANPADLPEELVKQLSLQPAEAEAITADVSQEIFLPIRDAMKKFMVEESSSSEVMARAPAPASEKSVIMPSAAAAPAPLAGQAKPAAPTPPAPKPSQAVPAPPAPAATVNKPNEMHAADLMLSQPTISVPPKVAPPSTAPAATSPVPKPSITTPSAEPSKTEAPPSIGSAQAKPAAPYKADPYREPPE